MRILYHCIMTLFSLLITAAIIFLGFYFYMEIQLPNVTVLNDVHMQEPLRIYSADNKLIAEYGSKRRIPITINQVPKPLIEAVLATEDQRFYSHPGVDIIGVVRALKAVILSGQKVQGASTITMQVARNFFLTDKKTFSRKINEMLLALKIEREFPKNKILELYLNKVYFGQRAYGVAAAAKVYYGKTLDQLTLAEMATIAGLPQAPSENNPISRPDAAIDRRNHVLERMLDAQFITQQQYEEAIKQPNTAKYHGSDVQLNAPYVAEMVRQAMVAQYGQDAYEHGFHVHTTILSNLQVTAEKSLQRGLIDYSKRHGFNRITKNFKQIPTSQWPQLLTKTQFADNILQPAAIMQVQPQKVSAILSNGQSINIFWPAMQWTHALSATQILHYGDMIWVSQNSEGVWQLEQIPRVQGAIISLNPQNGAVLALTGGFDYQLNQFNRVTQAERQPGSGFKPFIYSAALAKGYTLASIINDAPIIIKQSGSDQWWRPHNDNNKFYGPTRLRVALTESRNLVSVRLLQDIGIPYTLEYIRAFGFDPNKLPHELSLALGSGVVTPWQLAGGYSVFANGGYQITPYFIQRISEENHLIFNAIPTSACQACIIDANPTSAELPKPMAPSVLTPQNAYIMNQVLLDVINNPAGTAHAAQVLGRHDLAGKTGTSNNENDAWFSGFNSQMVTTVWVGYDNYSSLHEFASAAALPIWIDYMKTALIGIPQLDMPEPPDIVRARIDPNTGLLARDDQNDAIVEVFQQGNIPKQVAPVQNSSVTPMPNADGGGLF